MLSTHVKASSITNLTDARYFAAWEVKWLGFQLDPTSEYFVKPAMVKAMMEWVDGVEIVGEFGLAEPTDILETASFLEIKTVQVGPFYTPDQVKALDGHSVIKEVVVESGQDHAAIQQHLSAYEGLADHFLLDLEKNGFAWDNLPMAPEAIQRLCWDFPIILSLNWEVAHLEAVLEQLQPAGINVRGGAEEKVGYKSFDELDPIFESLETYPN